MSEYDSTQPIPVAAEPVQYSTLSAEPTDQEDILGNLLIPICRRWHIVLTIFLVLCLIGGTAIYFYMGKKYDTEGAVRISMAEPRILYDTENQMVPYNPFKKTQADSIGFDNVLNQAADELADKKNIFVNANESPIVTLRRMIVDKRIKIDVPNDNELIYLRMTTDYPRSAEELIDALLRAYMSVVVSEESQEDDEKLTVLEDRRRVLKDRIEVQKLKVRAKAKEFGTYELSPYQESMQQQMATLQSKLTEIAIQRILLETKINAQENNLGKELTPEDIARQKAILIEKDFQSQALRDNIKKYELLVREGQVLMKKSNPELRYREETLQQLEERLVAREAEIVEAYKDQIQKEIHQTYQKELKQLKEELSQVIIFENGIRKELKTIDASTVGIGHLQFDINDAQEELDQMKLTYNEISTKIEHVNLERSSDHRISIASYARSVEAKGKRRKMAAATVFGGLASGMLVAFVLDKLDKRIKAPKEVTKRIGVRVIGTTTNPTGVDKKLLPQKIVEDYQTIRTNMSLLEEYKDIKMIAVTSPGISDGKTTFSANLAVTFARSGKRTLLIDGDLRKPDLGQVMKLPRGMRGLQDYLFGMDIAVASYKVPDLNLDILAADNRNTNDALELITVRESFDRIQTLRSHYEYIIIDTPPVLACPDALVWAKMADGVVLMSFLGRTCKDDIKEASERLEQINVKILGTVVNNVKVAQGYQRYGYGYTGRNGNGEKSHAHKKRTSYSLVIQDEIKAGKIT